MAYDSARGVTVLNGGDGIWEWDGTTWTQQMINGPSTSGGPMVYDSARGVMVMFGGPGVIWELGPACPAPSLDPPSDAAVLPGSAASFSVGVSGGIPTTMQWRHNGMAMMNGGRISGVDTADLTILGVQSSDQGAYDCVASNDCANITSNAASLSCAPLIVAQPSSVEVTPCQTAVFRVAAEGPPAPSYRWRRNGTNLNNNTRISGVTTPTLTISPAGSFLAGNYDVVLTNACGSSTSQAAQLVLRDPADYNGDGDVGTDADIEDFFACLAGSCCARCLSADFNNDGDLGTDADIEDFFRVLAGGDC
jgi:hypothetical protein